MENIKLKTPSKDSTVFYKISEGVSIEKYARIEVWENDLSKRLIVFNLSPENIQEIQEQINKSNPHE